GLEVAEPADLPKGDPLGRPATPVEKAFEMPATDHVLDDSTTYLAALRLNLESNGLSAEKQNQLQILLAAAQIIKQTVPQPEAVKKFLEASRADALHMLHQAWLESQTFDELRMIPTIICEGEWTNQPQITREFLVNLIEAVPAGK